MPLDVLGCTRATLIQSMCIFNFDNRCSSLKRNREWVRLLKLLISNEELLVSMCHHFVLIMSLPFVHTARRSYRLSDPVNNSDCDTVRFLNVVAESLVNLIT